MFIFRLTHVGLHNNIRAYSAPANMNLKSNLFEFALVMCRPYNVQYMCMPIYRIHHDDFQNRSMKIKLNIDTYRYAQHHRAYNAVLSCLVRYSAEHRLLPVVQ